MTRLHKASKMHTYSTIQSSQQMLSICTGLAIVDCFLPIWHFDSVIVASLRVLMHSKFCRVAQ
jgi:hypothetical protein